uniref:Synaptobrevin-like isoform X1 n=2 Tax=Crassostrea virginica TaxID=6565 RepID=A0A8B8EJU2_CRAVI|nr:synaptobrevin-like isoform X1 [Crassostrea virginica]XP_022339740.1 synaptobrevin-like isoform X1 [Crassostrea virginica]XP_022339748.1 synaptobrevin-like isoform X1 [Crassostrea virginica]XP_022339758.1 synaptobrevin-like isoform X1 [Crassostrea virginica]XP_022339764.1 synaptobrevin-like isoform X1 [Crassostrea virginica]
MKRKKDQKIKRGRHMRKGVKKRQNESDADPENTEEVETCLLKEDQRCRSLEELYTVETESKEMREIVRINSIRKTKSVDDILREQLEEVKDVMHKNIIKIRDREGKLDDLLNRGDVLTGSCAEFMMVSKKVQRKQKLKKWKYRILAAIVVAVVVVVVIVVVVVVVVTQNDNTSSHYDHVYKSIPKPVNETR